MINPSNHLKEKERLKLLQSYFILDTKPEPDFDNIVSMAAQICKTPIALISLVDEKRQWFKAHHGINNSETPREYSFCAHAINTTDGILIIEDARLDKRFCDNPLVVNKPNIVFYAGIVLKNHLNLPIGTLCVIDQKKHNISADQIEILKKLANQLIYLLENRKNKILLDSALKKIKQNAKQSKINENQLKLIHKNIPVTLFQFVIKKNYENYFSYISNSFKKIFPIELPLNEVNWMKYINLFPDDYVALNTKLNKIDKNTNEFHFIGRLIIKEEIIWFEINSNVIFKDDKIILEGTIKNITRRKNIEDSLRKKTIFNELVLNNIPADIALFDKDHNYLFINQNGIKNHELREWLIGKNDFDYCAHKGIENSLAKVRRDYFNEAVQTKKEVNWIDEINNDGTKTYIYRRFYPFFIDNVFAYMIGYGIDITELKKVQNELSIQNKILQEKNKELERFAYIASHDLQEPLLSIIGYSSLLDEDYKEKLDDDGKLYLDFINKSANRMRNLITALMEYGRIEQKETVVKVDFNHLLDEVIEDLSIKINNYNAKIKYENLPIANCYQSFIRILFQNLISNAIKFTDPNTTPIVTISCQERETDWIFQVGDNGIGIDPKYSDEIFYIFKRLHNENEFKGNGIGLAHCKKIVTIHNGDIWVESTLKKGSTFYFTISKNI